MLLSPNKSEWSKLKMKKVGYFFYTFVPLLAVEAIQTIALFFMMGMGVFGQGFVGKLAFPSANVSDRLEKTFTSVNFNMMIMVIYALITIAIFGMWYYACLLYTSDAADEL